MKRSEAARYARWSAAAALLLAAMTSFVYLDRDWVRHIERKRAPAPAPIDVSRQSNGISFKKVEQNRTVFTVDASRSTEFKGEDASLIEDVKITIFGNTGARHDTIHTKSCQYGRQDGSIHCSGDVQIDLLSAEDAKRTEGNPTEARALAVHVETKGVSFDKESGVARTDQPVIFAFPSGNGSAVGMEYQSDEGKVWLLKDVRFELAEPVASEAKKPGKPTQLGMGREVLVTGAGLEFGRDTRLMRLIGPAKAEMQGEQLTAGEILLALDKNFQAETLVATAGKGGRPEMVSQSKSGQLNLNADTLTAHFAPGGWVTNLEASGAIHAMRNGAEERDEAKADTATLDLWPKAGQPKELNMRGSVELKTKGTKSGAARVLETDALRVDFSAGGEGEGGKPRKAETMSAGSVEWTDLPKQTAGMPARTKLEADKLVMEFGPQGKPRQLQADGNVRTERSLAEQPLQTATARSGLAQMDRAGGWSQIRLHGDVKLVEGDRNGSAEHAVFERASQTATLTENAAARDATTETHAQRITFAQMTGDIRAEGQVRSTDFSAKGSTVQLAPVPLNITADALHANSKTGHALYTGHARLWQGESVLEADSIELQRETRVLNAVGNVRAVFPQVAWKQTPQKDGPAPRNGLTETRGQANDVTATRRKPQLWRVSCGMLTYLDAENRAHLEHNVMVQSAEQRMRAPVLDLYFTRGAQPGGSVQPGENSGATAQQISRAVGAGGVTIDEGSRKATAERGEYVAASGKFVMSGGNPTLYDGSAGTTTGRQLTFFLSDDTIIVDSENGSRTLTKHRVEK